jgi:hypothetical protein
VPEEDDQPAHRDKRRDVEGVTDQSTAQKQTRGGLQDDDEDYQPLNDDDNRDDADDDDLQSDAGRQVDVETNRAIATEQSGRQQGGNDAERSDGGSRAGSQPPSRHASTTSSRRDPRARAPPPGDESSGDDEPIRRAPVGLAPRGRKNWSAEEEERLIELVPRCIVTERSGAKRINWSKVFKKDGENPRPLLQRRGDGDPRRAQGDIRKKAENLVMAWYRLVQSGHLSSHSVDV